MPNSFTRLYIVIGSALSLSFLLSISGHHTPTTSSFKPASVELTSLVKEKAEELTKVVAVGKKGHFAALDPLAAENVFLLFNDEHGYVNCSTDHIEVRGLQHLKVLDVATNDHRRDASVQFAAQDILIRGQYVIKHKKHGQYGDDQGKFELKVQTWSTSWSAHVHDHFNHSYFAISELAIESRPEQVTYEFHSSQFGRKIPRNVLNMLNDVTSTVLDKLVQEVDNKLYSATEQIAKVQNWRAKSKMSGPEALDQINRYNLHRSKRQVPCERGEELDEYVDSLFRFASRLIRAMEPFSGTIPNVTVEVPEYQVIIFLHQGGATHAYTIQRKKPAWVMCTNESISLGLTLGFEELRVSFKFRIIQNWKLLFDGEMEAQITKPKIQVQFTQTTPDEDSDEQVQQRVDALRIWSLGQIRIMLKGLGNLTQAMSIFLTGFINRNLENFMPQIRTLETQAVSFANNLLQNISIPFFSII